VITTEVDPGSGSRRRPFTLHGRALTPAIEVLRGTRGGADGGRILVLGYGLADVARRLQATIVGANGDRVGEVRFLARAPGEGSEPDLVIAALPRDLPPGSYTVQVSLTGDDGTVRGRTAARFRLEESIAETTTNGKGNARVDEGG
jgi:hypothetical protein